MRQETPEWAKAEGFYSDQSKSGASCEQQISPPLSVATHASQTCR